MLAPRAQVGIKSDARGICSRSGTVAEPHPPPSSQGPPPIRSPPRRTPMSGKLTASTTFGPMTGPEVGEVASSTAPAASERAGLGDEALLMPGAASVAPACFYSWREWPVAKGAVWWASGPNCAPDGNARAGEGR